MGFTHETSSPRNSKSNGAAETAVKIAKLLMKRCRKAKEDPYLGLLSSGGTCHKSSSTYVRKTDTTVVPTTMKLLEPACGYVELEKRIMEHKQALVAEHYNNKRNMKPLAVRYVVRIQPIETNKKHWKEATVSKRVKSRSYDVITAEGKT